MDDDLYQKLAAVLNEHLPDRYLDSIDINKLAQAVGDLMIDLAGTGQLLASIDRIARS